VFLPFCRVYWDMGLFRVIWGLYRIIWGYMRSFRGMLHFIAVCNMGVI